MLTVSTASWLVPLLGCFKQRYPPFEILVEATSVLAVSAQGPVLAPEERTEEIAAAR